MQSKHELTETELLKLLSWLDHDPEQAGMKYELIRRGLIRIFTCRGCFEADVLADETINRVARKAEALTEKYAGDPAHYFFGVAKKVYLEYQRKRPLQVPLNMHTIELSAQDSPDELKFECLQHCMYQLPAAERELIWHYYEPGVSATYRALLAKRFGLKLSTLRVKVFRLTSTLEECMNKCMQRGGPD